LTGVATAQTRQKEHSFVLPCVDEVVAFD